MRISDQNPQDEVVIEPLEIKVLHNNLEEALKRFKAKVQKEKIIQTYKQRQSYEKPSEKIRRKKREARERTFLAEMREAQILSGEWDKRQKRKEQKRQQKLEKIAKKNQTDVENK